MIDYSLLYVIFYSTAMSFGAALAFVNSGLKKRFRPIVCFLLLFIPKIIYNFSRFYIESFGSNTPMVIILIIFPTIFDFMLLFAVFENTFQEKLLMTFMMDMIFIPILIVKQFFETRYQVSKDGPLVFDNFRQLLVLMLAYTAAFALILTAIYGISRLLSKINYNTRFFNIFGKIALVGYLVLEIFSIAGYIRGFITRGNNIPLYGVATAIWAVVFTILYIINSYFTKKRLMREIEALNSAKEREYEYYSLVKKNNDEIRKIRHDLNGHFAVLNSLLQDGDYDRLKDYITRMSDAYSQIKRVIFTQNPLADAVITSAYEQCREQNIAFDCSGVLPDDCFIDDVSLTCIFSNILNNALEACERVTDRPAYISLEVICRSDCIVISCKNSKNQDETPEQNRFRSLKNKTGHGFGVRILKDIVSGYDGVVNFEDTGDEFEVSLLLPQKETAVTAGG